MNLKNWMTHSSISWNIKEKHTGMSQTRDSKRRLNRRTRGGRESDTRDWLNRRTIGGRERERHTRMIQQKDKRRQRATHETGSTEGQEEVERERHTRLA